MEYSITDEAMTYAEEVSEFNAERFLGGWQDWNEDNVLTYACVYFGHDHDFIWLASRVLFGPAVVYVATGKSV
jgi:hypothetical protein